MNADVIFHVFGQATILNRWRIRYIKNMNKLYYVHSGSAIYCFKGKEYCMVPGKLYLFPASAEVTFKLDANALFEHTFFDFLSISLLHLSKPICINVSDYKVLKYTIMAICEVLSNARYGYDKNNYFNFARISDSSIEMQQIMKSYFKAVLMLINSITPINTEYDERIYRAIEYIKKNYNKNISVKQLAALSYLDENYFIKLFKKNIGKTPHQYIKDYRLNIAVSMLEAGRSVTEVSALCGYASLSAFSYAFKHSFDISPQEFQNKT